MRRVAERPLAPIHERRPHAVRFGANAVEGVIGDKQDPGWLFADNFCRLRISLPVRLEIASLLHRDDVIEAKADVRGGGGEHVAVAVREDRQDIWLRPPPFERRHHMRAWPELLDLAHE